VQRDLEDDVADEGEVPFDPAGERILLPVVLPALPRLAA
jgi:hypothetical protein